jgi:hypothetical protein
MIRGWCDLRITKGSPAVSPDLKIKLEQPRILEELPDLPFTV